MELSTCQNSAEPQLLRLGYHNLSSDGYAAPSWGIAVDVGTPRQRFSLRPSIYDLTQLSNKDHCYPQYGYDCLAPQGGVYDPTLSRTGNESDYTVWNGTLGPSGGDETYYIFYNDVLRFGSNETTIWGFPFVTDDAQDWAIYNSLGLGMNSTFLHAAVESGTIPSMSWGLWVGSRSLENKQDGVLVLGGYDDARKATDFSTFDNSPECTGCIQIQNLTWVSDAGVIPLMNESLTDFQVGVDPEYDRLDLPQVAWELFGVATNGVYDADLGRYIYAVSDLPEGSLSFTIKDGYTTSIPASELFRYLIDYDNNGNEYIANDTIQYTVIYDYINQDSAENYVYTWGFPFLTMNYLVFNMEQQKFQLTEAIRQDFGNEGGVMSKKLCTGGPIPDDESGGVNIGAIVGGVVGGVAVLLILALALFFYCRRRKKTRGKAVSGQDIAPPNQTYQAVAPGMQTYPPPGAVMYPISPGGTHPAQVPMGYPGQPPVGYAPMTQYHASLPRQASYPMYSPPNSPPGPTASVVYSDTASTAVQELPSVDNNGREWRGSEFSSETAATKGLSIHTSETPYKHT